MNNMKKSAFAIFAAITLSGCASNQVAQLARPDAAPVLVTEHLVSRPLPGYSTLGGYRVRRLAAVAVAG